jgi:tRNA threonylcarbamoyladenosine biosynthesis protein TsaB
MKLMAVDTATKSCSVAILERTAVIAEFATIDDQTHSTRLLPMVDMVLTAAGIKITDLDGLSVTVGPGSFTGLRIGLGTVKGLGWAIGKPVVGVSTLDALAHQADHAARLVCPILDARRGEVYAAVFHRKGEQSETLMEETAMPLIGLKEKIRERCVFVGNGAVTYRRDILQLFGDRAVFAPEGQHEIRASTVGRLAYRRFRNGWHDELSTLVPNYIRKSDARPAAAFKSMRREPLQRPFH